MLEAARASTSHTRSPNQDHERARRSRPSPRSPTEPQSKAALPRAASRRSRSTLDLVSRSSPRPTPHLARTTKLPALLRALDGRFIAPGARRRPAAQSRGAADGTQPARLRSLPACRAASQCADGSGRPQRLLERACSQTGHSLPEVHRDGAVGHGQPQDRRWADRPGPGADGRQAPLRQLRPHRAAPSCIPLEELEPPAHRCGRDAVRHLPRPAARCRRGMLAEAAWLAASADEPLEQQLRARNALAYQAEARLRSRDAALRVFSNADGAYGSNVNHLIDGGCWDERGRARRHLRAPQVLRVRPRRRAPVRQPRAAAGGAWRTCSSPTRTSSRSSSASRRSTTTSIPSAASAARVARAAGRTPCPVYIGDQTRRRRTVRTLSEQVALESRTRVAQPEAGTRACSSHGHEGVRQIEAHITNTSAGPLRRARSSPGSTSRC